MPMMKYCSFCGVHLSELQRCSRCKAKFYCSRVCQQNHWKEGHKKECREVSVDEMKNICSFCGIRSSDLMRCSRCKGEFYCSRECQRNHWKAGHERDCKEVSIDDSSSPILSCTSCKKRSEQLKRCTGCLQVSYCSRECQRQHWTQKHKDECVKIHVRAERDGLQGVEKGDQKDVFNKESTVDEEDHKLSSQILSCTSCKKPSEQLQRCTRCLKVSYCSRKCQSQDWTQKHKDECVKIHVRAEERDGLQGVEKGDQKDVFNKESTVDEEDNDHKPLNVCTVCRKTGTIKVCQRCKLQKYCSPECQKADWKTHKSICTVEGKPTCGNKKGPGSPLPICANCRSQSAELRCSGCRVVYYCSKDCQKSDWNKHKTSCKAYRSQPRVRETLTIAECSLMGLVTPEEHGGRNQNDGKIQFGEKKDFTDFSCNRCLKKLAPGTFNVTCTMCKSSIYCSEHCMELDKSEHKKTCATSDLPGSGITMSSCVYNSADGQSLRFDISPSHAKLPYPRNPLFVTDNADLKWIVERTAQSRSKAIEKTKRKFPYHTLITRLREIPIEGKSAFSSNIATLPYVFLAYIRRFHNYRGCHSVYLQDSDRREIYASFYLPNDDPTPYFQWSDVVPGKFVAVLFPCIHFFLDFTVGLRVDKAKNFYCFDVKD
ncbi:uncharacterized protein LOC133179178 [Saccostrea echinata]|uniref:uncharacterized protein LOC133179178 n=1 Tax=Saccostrea echinata TaxID=191078 RepID=UPI002A823DD0|nr:uncharacterized protein LOC133179178 [Saccostrea echinata]